MHYCKSVSFISGIIIYDNDAVKPRKLRRMIYKTLNALEKKKN